MKQRIEIKNIETEVKKIKEKDFFKNLTTAEKINLEIIVGNNSRVTLKNIIFLYQLLELNKEKEINSCFAVDKESELAEEEFYLTLCENEKDLVKNLKKISLNEILK